MDKRNCRFELRLNEKEKNMLEKKSIKAGVTKAAFIKMCLSGSEIKPATTSDYKELIKEINYIGHNINQIAKAVNLGIALPEDIKAVQQKLDKIYELIRENI